MARALATAVGRGSSGGIACFDGDSVESQPHQSTSWRTAGWASKGIPAGGGAEEAFPQESRLVGLARERKPLPAPLTLRPSSFGSRALLRLTHPAAGHRDWLGERRPLQARLHYHAARAGREPARRLPHPAQEPPPLAHSSEPTSTPTATRGPTSAPLTRTPVVGLVQRRADRERPLEAGLVGAAAPDRRALSRERTHPLAGRSSRLPSRSRSAHSRRPALALRSYRFEDRYEVRQTPGRLRAEVPSRSSHAPRLAGADEGPGHRPRLRRRRRAGVDPPNAPARRERRARAGARPGPELDTVRSHGDIFVA